MGIQQQGLSAARDEIARRTRQQAALAELGQAAPTRAEVGLLVGQTCAVVEWALGASYVSIVQAKEDNGLALRFGVGSNASFSAMQKPFEARDLRKVVRAVMEKV